MTYFNDLHLTILNEFQVYKNFSPSSGFFLDDGALQFMCAIIRSMFERNLHFRIQLKHEHPESGIVQ